jgi:hypothetical protein
MVAKNYILLAAAILFAGIFFFTVLNKLDGFQNAPPAEGADIKTQMCEIFRETYRSLSSTVSKMEKSNVKVSDAMAAHLNSIKTQMEEHGC